jgi:mono/diheme cytochrome c family protein
MPEQDYSVKPSLPHQFRLLALVGTILITGFLGGGLGAADGEAHGPSTSLPPLSEARAAGRLKSSYLNTVATAKAPTATGTATANLSAFKNQIGPTLKTTCLTCHGPDKQKGQFRVDTLDPDLLNGGDVGKWLKVFDVVSNGEMPPENDKNIHLDAEPRRTLTTWLEAELQKASRAGRSELGATSFRRMTRYEYNYALQDLTGLPYEFAELLPPETVSKDGFLNSSALLQMSGMQFERYRELGLKALQKATVKGPRPPVASYAIAIQDLLDGALAQEKKDEQDQEKKDDKDKEPKKKTDKRSKQNGKVHLRHLESGIVLPFKDDFKPRCTILTDGGTGKTPAVSPAVVVIGPNQSLKMNLGETLPDDGIMRVRLRVGRTTREANDYVAVRLILSAHTSNNANFSEVISRRDIPVTAPADQPEFIHFDVPLSEITRNPFRKKGGSLGRPDEFLTIQVVSNAGGKNAAAPLAIQADYIDIIAPFYEQWPPKSHTDIFVASKNQGDEKAYGGEVLTQFMTRAWRRPVSTAEVAPFQSLLAKYRPGFATFEEAMLEVLSTVLAAPDFLYLTHKLPENSSKKSQPISDLELATRLSFFLWCSLPDQELLGLAKQSKLSEPKTLAEQTKRLLADPRAQRFSQNFVEQWLGLEALGNVAIDESRFKGSYDRALKDAMREEPLAFFREVLRQNHSVMDFLHSDYVVVNERLAKHYQMPAVYGPDFRVVPIDATVKRGGLLTAAGLLAMNSDGKDSHTVKRGVWILNRLLNDPPPPPPPNVPEVDLTNPEIAKMSLKERIADHRDKPACYSCHAKIDPWGIALENYDAIGAFRTQVNNKPVDATATLFNHQPLAGMDGLKRYLLADRQDQFARAMVHKLTSFALGRTLSFGDRAEIDGITARLRKSDDRLGNLITLITTSDLFRAR